STSRQHFSRELHFATVHQARLNAGLAMCLQPPRAAVNLRRTNPTRTQAARGEISFPGLLELTARLRATASQTAKDSQMFARSVRSAPAKLRGESRWPPNRQAPACREVQASLALRGRRRQQPSGEEQRQIFPSQ